MPGSIVFIDAGCFHSSERISNFQSFSLLRKNSMCDKLAKFDNIVHTIFIVNLLHSLI